MQVYLSLLYWLSKSSNLCFSLPVVLQPTVLLALHCTFNAYSTSFLQQQAQDWILELLAQVLKMEIIIPANLLAMLLLVQLRVHHSKSILLAQHVSCPPGSPHPFVQRCLLASQPQPILPRCRILQCLSWTASGSCQVIPSACLGSSG